MKLKKGEVSSEIPTASMADITFLLIVYFMVMTTFAATRGLDFALPKDDENPPIVDREESVLIEIQPSGELLVDQKPMPLDGILESYDYDPKQLLPILEATQEAYGYLPVAALKRISHITGAWYAMIYGTASYYGHLRFEPPGATAQAAAVAKHRPSESTYLAALDSALGAGGGPAATAGA